MVSIRERLSLPRFRTTLIPSSTHGSLPETPSVAAKKSAPFKFVSPLVVKESNRASPAPGWMSLIRVVPALLPLLYQSSMPRLLFAAKTSVPFTFVSSRGMK